MTVAPRSWNTRRRSPRGYCHVKFLLNETSPRRAGSGRRQRWYRPDPVAYTPIVPHFRTAVAAQEA